MISRRLIVTALACSMATAARAQGRKSSATGESVNAPRTIGGHYTAHGRDAAGAAYSGVADVVQSGNRVEFTWLMSGDTIHGQGTIEGRLVTVDWGSDTPVVYVVMPDGELHGTWEDGAASEKLIPN